MVSKCWGKPIYALHPASHKFPQCCFWNGFSVGQIDNGPVSSFQGILSTPAFLYASLHQAIDGVMSMVLNNAMSTHSSIGHSRDKKKQRLTLFMQVQKQSWRRITIIPPSKIPPVILMLNYLLSTKKRSKKDQHFFMRVKIQSSKGLPQMPPHPQYLLLSYSLVELSVVHKKFKRGKKKDQYFSPESTTRMKKKHQHVDPGGSRCWCSFFILFLDSVSSVLLNIVWTRCSFASPLAFDMMLLL